MSRTRIAKIFRNGASQAVRLPAEFRIAAKEVYVWRDSATGDVVLSTRPGAEVWKEFFDFVRTLALPADFLKVRPLNVARRNRVIFKKD